LREVAETLRKALRRKPPADSPKPSPSESTLKRELVGVERSISKHEQVVSLARDKRVGQVLQALADDRDLAREAAADPYAFATGRGLELPETMVIDVVVAGSDIYARIANIDEDVPFQITWTEIGFQAPPDPAASASREADPRPSVTTPRRSSRAAEKERGEDT
jgi:hypothetical protein